MRPLIRTIWRNLSIDGGLALLRSFQKQKLSSGGVAVSDSAFALAADSAFERDFGEAIDLRKAKRHVEALELLDRLLLGKLGNFGVEFEVAKNYRQLGRLEEARHLLQSLTARVSDAQRRAHVFFELAGVMRMLESRPECELALEQALQLKPNFSRAALDLARVRAARAAWTDAAHLLLPFVQRTGAAEDEMRGLLWRCVAEHMKSSRETGAAQVAVRLVDSLDDLTHGLAAGLANIAAQLTRGAHRDVAAAWVRRAFAIDAKQAASAVQVCCANLLERKRLRDATEFLAMVPDEVSELRVLLLKLGTALRKEKKSAALKVLERCARLAKDADYRILLELARAHINAGKTAKAIKIYESLPDQVSRLELRARVHYETGLAFKSLNRQAEARREFSLAYETSSDMAGPRVELARIAYSDGDAERALELLSPVVAEQPAHRDAQRLRGEALLKLRRVEEAVGAFEAVALGRADGLPALLLAARAGRAMGIEPAVQLNLIERAVAQCPDHSACQIDLGKFYLQSRRPEKAFGIFEHVVQIASDNHDAHYGIGISLIALGKPERAEAALLEAVRCNPRFAAPYRPLGNLCQSRGDLARALEHFSTAIELLPEQVDVLLARARVRYEQGEFDEAVADCETAQRLSPDHPQVASTLRWVKKGLERAGAERSVGLCLLRPLRDEEWGALAALGELVSEIVCAVDAPRPVHDIAGVVYAGGGATWRDVIGQTRADYVITVCGDLPDAELLRAHVKRAGSRIGLVSASIDSSEQGCALWAGPLLRVSADVVETEDWITFAKLLNAKSQFRALVPGAAALPVLPAVNLGQGREAWLVSSSGVSLFGGVEQFLRNMVPLYRSLGFKPVIVGLQEKLGDAPLEGVLEDIPFLNITRSIHEIVDTVLRRDVAIVHGTTGIGYELAAALDGFDTRIVYGSHFWRDMFDGTTFADIDRVAHPRPEFGDLCAGFDQCYANSFYTQDVIEHHFGMVHPIVYSLPFDVAALPADKPLGEYVLLMNGRPDKGLTLVLELSQRLPDVPFVVVASQISRERVEELIQEAGGRPNIRVIDWVRNTAELYEKARAVLVPSYSFVETFSRVTIEAQRYGAPVLGSNRGNVPLLLKDSGVVLEEDPVAWAQELRRIFDDSDYARQLSKAARENADLYPFDGQAKRVEHIVRAAMGRVAIALGSGIGNIVQCTPLIRRVAEYYGHPVDILLREDFPGCTNLLKGAPWIGSIYPADAFATRIRYDAVLVLDCFGRLIPNFNADVVHVTRYKLPFDLTRNQHESEFNLRGAEVLMGVPFEQPDVAKYFVGDVHAKAQDNRVIGIHAGCKDGVWMVKRWPWFVELVGQLREKGYEVWSFGGPDEYVEGTVDKTGTRLATTIENIAACRYFVANDSGLMHIADALDIPLTTIFAPTSVVKNGPLAPSSRVIKVEKSCSPCQFDQRKMATCNCIREIPLSLVAEKVFYDLEAT